MSTATVENIKEAGNAALDQAQKLIEEGSLEEAKKAFADGQSKFNEAAQMEELLQYRAGLNEKDQGERTEPGMPSLEEGADRIPNDTNAKRDANYKPPGYINKWPAAIQSAYVREHMGDNLKEQASNYNRLFRDWFQNAAKEKQWLASLDTNERQALAEGTDEDGGFFVPEDVRTTVIVPPGTPSNVMRPHCTVFSTARDAGSLPVFSNMDVYNVAEAANVPQYTPDMGQVKFYISKHMSYVLFSNELLEDSAVNLPTLVNEGFARAFALHEDGYIITGDGSSSTPNPVGVKSDLNPIPGISRSTRNTPNPIAVEIPDADAGIAGGSLTRAAVGTWYKALPAQYRQNALWATSTDLMVDIWLLDQTDSKGGLRDAPEERLLGKRMALFDGNAPATATVERVLRGANTLEAPPNSGTVEGAAVAQGSDIDDARWGGTDVTTRTGGITPAWDSTGTNDAVVGVLGDFRAYYIIDRMGISLKRDDSVRVLNDQVAFIARKRWDGRVSDANAFRRLLT